VVKYFGGQKVTPWQKTPVGREKKLEKKKGGKNYVNRTALEKSRASNRKKKYEGKFGRLTLGMIVTKNNTKEREGEGLIQYRTYSCSKRKKPLGWEAEGKETAKKKKKISEKGGGSIGEIGLANRAG